jgi:SAM-dependent methyltransferase
VEKSEILHVDANDKSATIIADLSNPHSIPENVADTFICTQTLNFIYDVKKAIHGIHRILKPGGKAIITVAGLSQISRFDMDRWGDYWRFTDKSLKKLLGECFDEEDIEIVTFGNVHSATMFLHGLAIEEVDKEKIAVKDENYQVLLGAIVTKKAPVAQSFLSTNFDKMLTTLAFFLIYPMQSKLKVYHTKIEQTVGAVAEMTNELEALITL